MGIIILAVTSVGVILALVSTSRASKEGRERSPSVPPPFPLPPSLDGETSLPPLVAAALDAMRKGTATMSMLQAALEEAMGAGLIETANQIMAAMTQLSEVTIPKLVSEPDRAAYPIPIDPVTGLTLWFEKAGSMRPRFRSVLIQFQALQQQIGVKDDGRIGPVTLATFQKSAADYDRRPRTIEDLAANAVKWTEILKNGYQNSKVGGPWEKFVGVTSSNLQSLMPKVEARLGGWVGREALGQPITMSGLLGIVQCAGMRGADSWLSNDRDKEKYPNTTRAFTESNGIF